MQNQDEICLIYTTFADLAEAKRIGQNLLEANMIACANILPKMTSLYQWQGKMETSDEVLVFFKTRKSLAQTVIDQITHQHSYDTPAVLVLDVTNGSADFCNWIVSQTSNP